MTAAYAGAKQLEVVVLVAAALLQGGAVVNLVIHPYRSTAGTGELVALNDPAPDVHP